MLFIGSSRVQLPLRQTECQRKPPNDGLFPGSVWMVGKPEVIRIGRCGSLPTNHVGSFASDCGFVIGKPKTIYLPIIAQVTRTNR